MEDIATTAWIDGIIKDLIHNSSNMSVPQLIQNVKEIIYPCNPNLAPSSSTDSAPWHQPTLSRTIRRGEGRWCSSRTNIKASCKDLQSGLSTIYWTLAFLISPLSSPWISCTCASELYHQSSKIIISSSSRQALLAFFPSLNESTASGAGATTTRIGKFLPPHPLVPATPVFFFF